MSNRLSIRTEYGAWPIWAIDDFGYIDPNQLPLEPETISQLLAWQAKLDDIAVAILIRTRLRLVVIG